MPAKPSNGDSNGSNAPLKKRRFEEPSGNGAKKSKLDDDVGVIELE